MSRNLLMRLILTVCALLCPGLTYGQGVRWDGITLSPSGRPVPASVAVCTSPGLTTTAAQVIGNTAILTMSSNPITAGFASNMSIVVSGFTGGDTYFNTGTLQPFSSTVTITAVSATTITFPLTHANASASSNGSVFQMGSVAQACAPLAPIFSDAAVSVPITQPGLVSSGIGNVGFYVNPGSYGIQYYGSGVTTYLQPLTLTMAFSTANNAFIGSNTFPKINNLVYLDGVVNTTLATCYAAIAANGGACVVPPNYTETLASSLTVNKPHSGFIFTGPATITMGTNQVIVTPGTHGVFFRAPIAFGGTDVTTGVRFLYSGNGKAFQVGSNAAATRAFAFENIKVSFSGATAGASGLYLAEVIYFDLHNPSVIGENVAGTFGIVCDGTGSLFCGTGRIDNPIIAFVGTGIFGTGVGANAMNAVTISGGTIQNPVAGGIGVDIENGDANTITSLDMESNTIALKLGAGATNNHALFRSETNTSDVTALASSNSNIVRILPITGTTILKTDAGTKNHFSLAIDGDFGTATMLTVQSPAGANTTFTDNVLANQAAVVPGAFEILNHLRMATGAKIDDVVSGQQAGITLKTGSGGGNYTGTNTGYANVDTTNLCALFTIPTGWKLAVTANGVIESVTAAVAQSFALSDIGTTCGGAGVTPLPGSERTYTPPAIATFDVGLSTQAVISGDGLNHAISLQAKTSAGADAWGIQNTSSTAAPSLIFTLMPSN